MASEGISKLFGSSLVDSKGNKVDIDTLKDKIIAIYFSAHWCPPVRIDLHLLYIQPSAI
jgi:cytochrome oxidase Cu insertion factor (SCO1/SenC/PrrC family)